VFSEALISMLPCRAQVSVVLQQRKEEALKVAEEAEVLARLEQEAENATNLTVETDGAEATDAKKVLQSTKVAHIVRAQLYWMLFLLSIRYR